MQEEQLTGSSANQTSAPSVTQPFLRELTDNNIPYPRTSGIQICFSNLFVEQGI